MTVYVFGNPDLKEDSLPIQIIPYLKKEFPGVSFEVKDPNEDWDIPEELIVIDTVVGIDRAEIFDDLKHFTASGKLTVHDFDVFSNLVYLKKLGKLKKIKIIGLSPNLSLTAAAEEAGSLLRELNF